MKLTTKETALLAAIAKGMDRPGNGWLHEMVKNVTASTAGVLSSLLSKGLVNSFVDEGCTFVELTDAGAPLVNMVRDPEDDAEWIAAPTTTKNAADEPIKVQCEGSRAAIERLLAMPNDYPDCLRDKSIRDVYGTGANLSQDDSGAYAISVSL